MQDNEENTIKNTEPSNKEDLTIWEELKEDNSVVKKYIVYISKDFIPLMDGLNTDERTAYINDAIQTKIDIEDVQKQKNKKIESVVHLILTIAIILALAPFALLFANKAIMATFENYKYSQDNFEKLYKQHFEKSKIYTRSVQYNKEHTKNK